MNKCIRCDKGKCKCIPNDDYRKGQIDMAKKILELINENKTKAELKGEILDLCYRLR